MSSRPTRDALHPTPLAEALLHCKRAWSAAAAWKRCNHRVRIPCRATLARFAPWIIGRPPTSTCALADLAWLSPRPTRGALHSTLLVEALLHQHHARSAAVPSECCGHSFRSPCHLARARFAPWITGQPPTEHTRSSGLGVVVFAANARRAPPHAVGRGASSPTLLQVGGCGFETSRSKPSKPVPRGHRALRPMETRPTAHGAHER